jgi:hypothetical protein
MDVDHEFCNLRDLRPNGSDASHVAIHLRGLVGIVFRRLCWLDNERAAFWQQEAFHAVWGSRQQEFYLDQLFCGDQPLNRLNNIVSQIIIQIALPPSHRLSHQPFQIIDQVRRYIAQFAAPHSLTRFTIRSSSISMSILLIGRSAAPSTAE